MALILSAATGNFNAGATWVGGIVPGAADEARASTGHTVTITANVTCTEISNAGTGNFILNSGVTLTANCTNKSATANVNLITFSSASPATANIVGNCTGGTVNVALTVNNVSTGTLTITGNVTAGSGVSAYAAYNGSTGSIVIIGNTLGGGATNSVAAYNQSGGTITITGNLTGGTNATAYGLFNQGTGAILITGSVAAATASGINNAGTGLVTITGNVTASTAAGVINNSTGAVTITGNVTASTAAGVNNVSTGPVIINGTLTPTTSVHALQCTNATGANITLSGSLIYASNGFAPTNCLKFLVNPTPTAAFVRFAKNGSTTYSEFYTADNTSGITGVATTDVRSGVSYGGGLVGACAVPPASAVAAGTAVDNTTGTATLTAANVRAALGMASANLDTQLAVLSNLDTTVSSRLAPSGTLATVTTLTNAPASVTPAQIRAEMDSNSTKLANLDATVSSRLASSAYSAAPTVTAIRQELDTNSTKLANLDATVSSRLAGSAYTSTSAAPTAAANAAAVRAELATELARVDVATSTRLASSAYTAPSNSDVAAIKAKTDLLNTDRLAQASTVATTGAQIAAALS